MNRTKPTTFSLLIWIFFVSQVTASEREAVCERAWESYVLDYSSDLSAGLSYWESQAPQCLGTGTYESRLAALLHASGQSKLALDILNQALDRNLPATESLRETRYGIEIAQALEQDDASNLDQIERDGYSLAEKFPQSVSVREQLALLLIHRGKHAAGALQAAQAIDINGNSWLGHRLLVVANVELGRHGLAIPHIEAAIASNPQLLGDQYFVYAAVLAYAKSNDLGSAKYLLEDFGRRYPQVKGSQAYEQLSRLLKLSES